MCGMETLPDGAWLEGFAPRLLQSLLKSSLFARLLLASTSTSII